MNSDRKRIAEKIGFSLTKGVHAEIVRCMDDKGVDIKDFFEMPSLELCDILGISRANIFSQSSRDEAYSLAWKELEFIEKHNIKLLYIGDEEYPERLRECYDAPVVLYMLGESDLNAEHFISVVGTRKATQYGANFCKSLVSDLGDMLCNELTVVSGLAYGIDALAHSACLDRRLPTVGVLAHGLNMIYPAAHRDLAHRIVKSGGCLLTEYASYKKALRPHFLERNRIVAGLSDVTIVVESDIKGGAMSTAQRSIEYDRDVMALPGKINDEMSRGCNHLIRKNKASMITCATDLIEQMNWFPKELNVIPRQRVIFPELSQEEKSIYDLLRLNNRDYTIDEIRHNLCIPMPKLQALLMELEFNGVIIRCPGNKVALSL